MNILTLEHVYKSYTDRNLLEDVSLGIQEHDKIGVVGVNGTYVRSSDLQHTDPDVHG